MPPVWCRPIYLSLTENTSRVSRANISSQYVQDTWSWSWNNEYFNNDLSQRLNAGLYMLPKSKRCKPVGFVMVTPPAKNKESGSILRVSSVFKMQGRHPNKQKGHCITYMYHICFFYAFSNLFILLFHNCKRSMNRPNRLSEGRSV